MTGHIYTSKAFLDWKVAQNYSEYTMLDKRARMAPKQVVGKRPINMFVTIGSIDSHRHIMA